MTVKVSSNGSRSTLAKRSAKSSRPAAKAAVKSSAKPQTKSQAKKSAKPASRASKAPVTSLDLGHVWKPVTNTGSTPYVWVNGELLPKDKAMVSVYDHGLLYGDGVFEGIRIYKGKIFKLAQHMERLYRCAERIHIKIPISIDDMVDIQRECIRVNGIKDGYIRLVVTRGYGTLGLDPRRCPVPGVICIADQIRLYSEENYENGMRVVVARRPKTPVACLDPRIKSLNYLNNILAKVEAIEAGCDEAIMLSTDGWVTECTGDNIFVVKNGVIYTPPPVNGESGLLEGVTRKFVMSELAPSCGIDVQEKMMRLDEVLNADEVFLTGTAAEMIAVCQIDVANEPHKISDGEGPITNKLRKKFRQVVTSDAIPED